MLTSTIKSVKLFYQNHVTPLSSHFLYTICMYLYEWRLAYFFLLSQSLVAILLCYSYQHHLVSFRHYLSGSIFTFNTFAIIVYCGISLCIFAQALIKQTSFKIQFDKFIKFTEFCVNKQTIGRYFTYLLLMSICAFSFDNLKKMIPIIQPFNWDSTLIKLDRILLLGHTPWQLIQLLKLDNLYVIQFLDICYISWFVTLPIGLILLILSTDSKKAAHLILAYCLIWSILGNLLATCVSSVGPCFYHVIAPPLTTIPPEITQLMNHLYSINLTHGLIAIKEQIVIQSIWNNPHYMGTSISAFPSLHVATSSFLYFSSQAYFPKFKIPTLLYTLVILIGSVVLGWHYLCDGIFALIGTWWIWHRLCPMLINKWP